VKSEREKMVAGEPYDAADPELVALRARAHDLCGAYNGTFDATPERRRELLEQLLGAGTNGAYVQPPFFCDYGFNLELGERVYFNFNCVVLDVCQVRIGAFTLFGPAVQIYTAAHPLDAVARRKLESGRPISIGSDCWIGGGAIILPGVTIGDRSVIGAGSVVTRDVPAGVMAAGNPCRVRRELGTD
jgi:maltose O-acetyltransferase